MTTWIRGTAILLLFGAVALVAPGYASAQPPVPASGAVLYEMTENLSLRALQRGQRRATSQLLGVALAGTPLCPAAAVNGAGYCVINATGSDNINLVVDSPSFGKGNFGGTFTVVVPGDNPTDAPELVVGRGHFSGKMDFSPALRAIAPLGTVEGEVGLNGSRPVPFIGTFRLPMGAVNNAFYLGASGWQPVLPNEQALGYPTVKFEISFPDVSSATNALE